MDDTLRPATEWELASMVGALAEQQIPVSIVGGASKTALGRPVAAPYTLTTAHLKGIPLYEPTELVMSARSGTPVMQVEAELAARGQMLPFEPIDLGSALGMPAGVGTIGGVFASNISGARRISAGSARDHLLGIKAVNGRGEQFKAGGRVMKNVTGYDVSRGICGSWGTLAVISEVTFKVLPMPDDVVTLVYAGLTEDLAIELMSAAMGTPYEISGTVHLTEALTRRLGIAEMTQARSALTFIRIENFTKSIDYRKEKLRDVLRAYGTPFELDVERSLKLWGDLKRLLVFPHAATHLWRISTSPKAAVKVLESIRRHMPVDVMLDWSGGLIWIETPASADAATADVRRAVAMHGGHATLIRADAGVRGAIEVFQPLTPSVERLVRGIKAAFDPLGILNPGRMYATI